MPKYNVIRRANDTEAAEDRTARRNPRLWIQIASRLPKDQARREAARLQAETQVEHFISKD